MHRLATIIAIVSTIVAVVVSVTWGLCSVEQRITNSFTVLQARRPFPASSGFLREEDALKIARNALDTADYSSKEWLPLKVDRSKAPDGRPDEFFLRNADDASSGQIMFRNDKREDWYRDLFVSFDRQGETLDVRLYRGK
jgi:hypothetical protein